MDLSFATIAGIGGPTAIISIFLGFFIQAYKARKTETREDIQTERTSESGIVETTSAALLIVRDEMTRLNTDIRDLRHENSEQRRTIEELTKRVRDLEWENDSLKRQLGMEGGK